MAATRNAVLDVEVPAGLKGVRVAQTAIGDVRGDEGYFHYRGIDATVVARDHTLEDAWALVLDGELPGAEEAASLRKRIGAARVAAFDVVDECLAGVPDRAEPLAALRAALAVYVARAGMQPWIDLPRAEIAAQALQLAAAVPVFVAAIHRRAAGEVLVSPDASAGHAADYLRMCLGATPTPEHARALEQYLILTIDHGFNASTFTARVVASTGADVGSAIIAALGSLSGPLHGGAPARALAMVDEIGSPERAEPCLRGIFERGDRLMGFGHPVYTTTDPRSAMLGDIAEDLGGQQVALARHVERTALALLEEYKPGRDLRTNVEFYAALVMRSVGLPDDLFTPTFAVSRVIGWGAHIVEQATPSNRIFRPSARYTGPSPEPSHIGVAQQR